MSVPNRLQELVAELDALKCQNCGGHGEIVDGDLGDIYYNVWKCKPCKGSGLRVKNARIEVEE